MSSTPTPLSSGHPTRGETRVSSAPLRLLLLAAALSATAGALATMALGRLVDASVPKRVASVAAQVPETAGGRDPSVPDAGSALFGREDLPDEPIATF